MAWPTASASLAELGIWQMYCSKIGCLTAVGPRHLEEDSWVVSSLGTPLRSYGTEQNGTEMEHHMTDSAYVITLSIYWRLLVFFCENIIIIAKPARSTWATR